MRQCCQVYNERLSREVPTQTIRLRWFGPSHKHVYVERQVHNERWTNDKTSRERFSIPEKYEREAGRSLLALRALSRLLPPPPPPPPPKKKKKTYERRE